MRYFNTEGPMDPAEHYCIDPLGRVNLAEILALVARKKYFVLHAPRQTGKTSILLALQDRLNSEGEYRCLYVNFEGGQAAKEDTARAMRTVLGEMGTRSRRVLQDHFVAESKSALMAEFGPDGCLAECLTRWTELDARPLVLLIDEIDTLVGDTLISVLRQFARPVRHAADWAISRRASSCAESGTCATIGSIPAGKGRTSRAEVPSTSRPSRCA